MSDKWNEVVDIEYTYDCPTDNYLEGTTLESITENYKGPARIIVLVDKETRLVETTLTEEEAYDGRPDRVNCDNIVVDCTTDPMVCEVLSDYHDGNAVEGKAGYNAEDQDVRIMKSITTPDGYSEFTYPYPLHPDELYDDMKSTYEDDVWNLHKNTNADILGVPDTMEEMRKDRNGLLMQSDPLMVSDMPESIKVAAGEFRQKLRDLPEALADTDPVFLSSSFPPTDLLSQ